jgi:riboflavin synthase
MFTGIVEATGVVAAITKTTGGAVLRLSTVLAAEMRLGESVAVNGVCLTVTRRDSAEFHADVGPETARVTTLGTLAPGQAVNLERPLRPADRLGGHFVLGHVDGIGIVESVRPEADSHWITIGFPATLAGLFIRKGSVAVDGVSLTVARLHERQFEVQVVPYTWQHTTFNRLEIGGHVNLECDMIGKYVLRALELSDTRGKTS